MACEQAGLSSRKAWANKYEEKRTFQQITNQSRAKLIVSDWETEHFKVKKFIKWKKNAIAIT